jgi:hypothetical protein
MVEFFFIIDCFEFIEFISDIFHDQYDIIVP